MRILLLSILFITFSSANYAQCPTASFSVSDTVCLNEDVVITNNSTGANEYNWDFCAGDLTQAPTATDLGNVGGQFNFPNQFTLVKENDKYYGFVTNVNIDALVRLDFGANILNTPTATTINITGGTLESPSGIKIIEEGNNWYALIVSLNSSKLYRLSFGSNIETNTASLVDLGNFGLLNAPPSIEIAKDTNEIYAFITNISSPNLTKLNFGSSITNTPTATSISVNNASSLWGLRIKKHCNQWIGLISNSGSNGNLLIMNWGNNLSGTPVETNLGSFVSGGKTGIEIINERGNYYALAAVFSQNKLIQLNFGDNLLNTPSFTDLGGFNELSSPRGVHALQDSSVSVFFVSNFTGSKLTRVLFDKNCSENFSFDTTHTPLNLSFSSGGTKYITLSAIDSFGNISYTVDSVFIESITPAFTVTNKCFPGATQFTDASTTLGSSIVNRQWDFGDSNTSNLQNPQHSYADTGTYLVKLVITTGFGCKDSILKSVHISPKPSAGFSFSSTDFCQGTGFSFNDTSSLFSGNINSWCWDFGTGDSALTQNPSYTFDTAGSFLVSLIITSDSGCSDTSSTPFTINPQPAPAFTTNSTCLGSPTQFDNSSTIISGNITSYLWDFDDTNTSTNTSPSHLYTGKGVYNVKLVATSDSNCVDSITLPVEIAEKGNPDFFWFPPTICQGTSVQFLDNSTSTDSITNYIWDFDTGDSATTPGPYYTFADTGLHDVTLTIMTGTGCDTSISQSVYINPTPNVGFTHSGVCFGETTFFTDTSSVIGNASISSWGWDFGDSNVSFAQNPTNNYPDTGTYSVTLNVSTDSGCQATTEVPVEIHSLPQASFTTTLACSDLHTSFFDLSSIAGDTINQWEWYFGDPQSGNSDTSFIKNPTHLYDSAGNYQVQLLVTSNYGCTDTITQTIQVIQSPIADYTFLERCLGDSTIFIENATGTIVSWNWDFDDGNNSNLESPKHLFDSAGFYNVTLITTAQSGCYDSATYPVKVYAIPQPDFGHDSICTFTTVNFYDSSLVENASINQWFWQSASNQMDTSTSQNPKFIYEDTGLVQVTLVAISNEGCRDSISKTLNINSSPSAGFSFQPQFGAPPLTVTFANESKGSANSNWLINGNAYSSTSPQHTFTDTGVFDMQLVAINANGCTDTIVKKINVREPILDIAITNVVTEVIDNYVQVTATLANLGTRKIYNATLTAETNAGQSIKETWEGNLAPGEIADYTFSALMEVRSDISPVVTCVIAEEPNQEPDDVPSNNEFCTNDEATLVVFDPYPNPANEQAILRIIVPEKDEIQVNLYEKSGKLADVLYTGEVQKGTYNIALPAYEYRAGIYALAIGYRSQLITKKWMKK